MQFGLKVIVFCLLLLIEISVTCCSVLLSLLAPQKVTMFQSMFIILLLLILVSSFVLVMIDCFVGI